MSDKPANLTIIKRSEQPQQRGIHYRIEKFDNTIIGPNDPVNMGRAVVANAFQPEDEFTNYYLGSSNASKKSTQAIQPPYDLKTLDRLCQENNALGPCIEAMVVNCEGTGFEVIKDVDKADEKPDRKDDQNISHAWDFFTEPYPGETFKGQRKQVRRDIERIGNGYLEIMRTAGDEVIMSRYADGKMIRLVKLGEPIKKKVKITRRGQEMDVQISYRPRKYVQLVNGVQIIYFKEFGCPLDLNKYTGEWAQQGTRLAPAFRASELVHFTNLPDAHTPYGVPRWISQLPSVLGSRKAEEFNLDFFDNGGVPPVMIFIQGGALVSESRKAIEAAARGTPNKKNRISVVEMEPIGSMDAPNNSKITVERFGAEKQNDAMFEKYDERSEIRVRRAFRLPPIFMGGAADYSFASAFASYTVAEAQVFGPEREAFDDTWNAKIMPAMGFKGYLMKSLPLVIKDATLRLQGIELAQTTMQVDAVEVLNHINEAVGTNFKVSGTLPVPDFAGVEQRAIEKDKAKASIKVNSTGRVQSNSTKKKPTAMPRRQPGVTKSEADITALFNTTLMAIATGDTEDLRECVVEIADLDSVERERLEQVVQTALGQNDNNVIQLRS